jgi:hypothetical protein
LCVKKTDGTSVTLFSTGTSGVEDEITLEELKRESDRRRYLEMADLAKYEKILKANLCRKQKNIPNQGTIIYNPV